MPELTEIGEVISLHGFKGELLIHFVERLDNLKKRELFFVQFDGMQIPFFVEQIHKKSKARYAITFRDVDTIEKASELLEAKILTETENILPPESDENDFLIGCKLYDKNEYIGEIIEFRSIAANDLLIVFAETKGKEVFIPYNEALIVEFDEANKTLRCNLPEGLLDIND